MSKGIVLVLSLTVASGCATEAESEGTERDLSDDEMAESDLIDDQMAEETPDYRCWLYSDYTSYFTPSITTWFYASQASDDASRSVQVRGRPGHPYSVELVTTDYRGPIEATGWIVYALCENDGQWHDSGWQTETGAAYPSVGCDGPLGGFTHATIMVRAANCH